TVTEDDAVTVSTATTGSGNIAVTTTTGDLNIGGPVRSEEHATLTATAGNILNGGGKVSGNLVTLSGGSVAANTKATTLALTGSGAGTITVTEDDAVTLSTATTGSGNIAVTTTTGDLNIGGPV